MIGIIVMTHGNLGRELINSSELIAGKTENVTSLSLAREDNIDMLSEKFLDVLKQYETCDDILVFADLLGGSPCNVASAHLRNKHTYQVITGANLPMLLEAIMSRDFCSIEELVEKCLIAAKDGTCHVNKMMK